MKSIGFTGTRGTVTPAQEKSLRRVFRHLIEKEGFEALHHGDCVGADAFAHGMITRSFGFKRHQVVLHPPNKSRLRAYCDAASRYPETPYLERNRRIVDHAQVLIAVPRTMEEEKRSGTWSTYRYARKQGKRIILIRPDGKILEYKARPALVYSFEDFMALEFPKAH